MVIHGFQCFWQYLKALRIALVTGGAKAAVQPATTRIAAVCLAIIALCTWVWKKKVKTPIGHVFGRFAPAQKFEVSSNWERAWQEGEGWVSPPGEGGLTGALQGRRTRYGHRSDACVESVLAGGQADHEWQST